MKTLIQDSETKMFYAVECAENPKGYLTSTSDEGSPGENEFSYWTEDITEAFDFGSEMLAKHEMNCNDVSEGGKVRPVVVNL